MYKLYNFLNNDKAMHFVYGIAMYALLVPLGQTLALLIVALIAGLKEMFDKQGYGTFEVKDAAFTIAGAFFLIVWYEVFSYVHSIV